MVRKTKLIGTKPNTKIRGVIKKMTISKGKCTICRGFGLWGVGDKSPMGPMDARDGCPTVECPKCHANANPIKR
jgi:hypothetical protein